MKSARTLITICLLFTAASLFGQTENRALMKVNIPFTFTAENTTLPAGDYVISTVTPERQIRIASADGKRSLIVNTLPNYTNALSPNSRLVFDKYGNDYFLAQVWTAHKDIARNPYVSKRAMELARSGVHPEKEVILAYTGH